MVYLQIWSIMGLNPILSPIQPHFCFVLVNFAVPTTVAKYYFQVQVFNSSKNFNFYWTVRNKNIFLSSNIWAASH